MNKKPAKWTTFERSAAIFIALSFAISLLAITGWLVNLPILASLRPQYIPMAPATALIFIGLCSFWLIRRVFQTRRWIRILVQAGQGGLLVIVLILAIRYFTGLGPDLERLLYPHPGFLGQFLTARMSPLAALGFILAIPAFLLLSREQPGKRTKIASNTLAVALLVLSGIITIGYLFEAPLFYGGTLIPVSVTTAISLLFLSLGLLLMTGPDCWPVRMYVGSSMKARLMRAFIPASILIALFQGLLSTVADSWILNPAIRAAIGALMAVLTIMFIISFIAQNLGVDIERSDQARLQVESALKLNEARFRTLVETAHDAIINIDQDGHIVFWNQAAEMTFGYSAHEMIGKSLELVMPEGFRNDHQKGLQRVVRTGETHIIGSTVEVSGLRRDGREFPMELSLATWQVAGEVFFTGIAQDITERKRAEAALQKSESELRALFAGMTDVVIIYDFDGRYVEIAPTNPANLFRPSDELLGKTMHEILPKKQADYIVSRIRAALQSSESVSAEYTLQIDAKETWFSASASRLSDTTAIWVAHDITERKRTEKKLAQLHLQNELILKSAAEGILGLDSNGDHTFVNLAAATMLGYEVEELIGRPSHSTWHHTRVDGSPYPREECDIYAAYRDGIVHHSSSEIFWRKDGTSFPVEYFSTPIHEQKRIVGAVVSFTNITQRKRSELVQNAIFRISQAALTNEGIDALCQSIHSILGELIPADNFFIALIDPASNLMSFPYYVDQFDEPPSGQTPIQGLTGHVIRTGSPLLAPRQVYEQLIKKGDVEAVGTVSEDWMGAPLKVEGRIIGVMVVQSYSKGIHFNPGDLEIVEFVSAQVAQAIERKRMDQEIRSLSLTDELTGLYNRRGFGLLAGQEVKLAHRAKKSKLLFFGDVDNLKTINDSSGHAQGDLALKEVAAVLKETFREADIVGRIGGDEFVVLAVDASMEHAEIIHKRLQSVLEAHNRQGDHPWQLSLSVGIVRYDPEAPATVNELIAKADGLMYAQKQARKESQ
jgi:diguanylate cyclase (GGDEF)-like protein/PAS domain S-box-containing protein